MDVIGKPEWLTDPRYATNAARLENQKTFRPLLNAILAQDTRENWISKFREAGVPAGSVRDLNEALAAPEIRARGMVGTVEHPNAGRLELVTSPIRYSATPVNKPAAPPTLGQHSAEILGDHGFTADEIAALAKDGIVRGVKA